MKQINTINDSFFTDGKAIYQAKWHKQQIKYVLIKEAHFETFKVHTRVIASDKSYVYAHAAMAEGLQIFKPEDMGSIIFIPDEVNAFFFADDYNLYNFNHHFISYYNLAEDSDEKQWLQKNYPERKNAWWNKTAKFYKKLKPVKHSIYSNGTDIYYAFDGEKFYDYPIYDTTRDDFFIQLKSVNLNTFKVLNDVYLKDHEQVYFYSRKIDADPETFKVVDYLFARDKNHIWYNGRIAIVKDIESFKVINSSKDTAFHFAQDQFTIYGSCTSSRIKQSGYASILKPFKNSDLESFEIINDVWAKDKNNVYWFGKIYKLADAATFKKIAERPLTHCDFAVDKNYVYLDNGQTVKKNLDGSTFQILNKFWAKDKYVVYSLLTERVQKNIDVNSFNILNDDGKAEDKNYSYTIDGYSVVKVKK